MSETLSEQELIEKLEDGADDDLDDYFDEEDHAQLKLTDETFPGMAFNFTVKRTADCIEALFAAPFVRGEFPCEASVMVRNVHKKSNFGPGLGSVVRQTMNKDSRVILFRGDGWLCLTDFYAHNKTCSIQVISGDDRLSREIIKLSVKRLRRIKESVDPGITSMNFWFRGSRGYEQNQRNIDVQPWADIRSNYPQAEALDKLIAVTPENISGKIILLYGPPGTGKTTFLRALSSEWRNWCKFHTIMDPEILFNDSGYLYETMLGRYTQGNEKWRLVILEDVGELISADARDRTGQALSRLLNVSDGMMGQGTKVIIGITTNEDIRELHPAISRPGRCMAGGAVEVGLFGPMEAADWLGVPRMPEHRPYSLAELIAMRKGDMPAPKAVAEIGQYL